jgi:hypothetical protein
MRPWLIVCLLFAVAIPAAAQTVNFAWDPHDQASQIAGFRLYMTKASGGYTGTPVATFTPGTATAGSIPQPALGRYFFVLRAFIDDPAGAVESDNSNEVTLVLKPKPPRLLSAIQTVLLAPIRGAVKAAGIIAGSDKRGLRIGK